MGCAGRIVGYFVGFFIFTTTLFFVLNYFGKFPESWNYFYLTGIVAIISCSGIFLERVE